MTNNKTAFIWLAILLVLLGGFFAVGGFSGSDKVADGDAIPYSITLAGTYECLPHLDTTGPQTEECAFGLRTDDNLHYAVNFGQSALAMEQFQSGARVIADGFLTKRIALSSSEWAKYNMEGVFTITKVLEVTAPSNGAQGKLNIDVVCQSALAYMSFPDAASAELFVKECKEGKHPEVIERYKTDMGYGDGATI